MVIFSAKRDRVATATATVSSLIAGSYFSISTDETRLHLAVRKRELDASTDSTDRRRTPAFRSHHFGGLGGGET
ncbi:MAG TPA: hypothetical protein VER96_24430 [Polyangiaceae bacterium]|nr:hypothetical protein [Polyangiaceae bacterium]